MKFYIASGFKNSRNVRELSAKLQAKGFIHTYDWTVNERASSYEMLKQIGEVEKEAVANTDFFIILLPAGKGSHIEFGMALALGKRIYLYSPDEESFSFDKTSTFYHVDGVNHFVGDMEDFASYLMIHELRKTQ